MAANPVSIALKFSHPIHKSKLPPSPASTSSLLTPELQGLYFRGMCLEQPGHSPQHPAHRPWSELQAPNISHSSLLEPINHRGWGTGWVSSHEGWPRYIYPLSVQEGDALTPEVKQQPILQSLLKKSLLLPLHFSTFESTVKLVGDRIYQCNGSAQLNQLSRFPGQQEHPVVQMLHEAQNITGPVSKAPSIAQHLPRRSPGPAQCQSVQDSWNHRIPE